MRVSGGPENLGSRCEKLRTRGRLGSGDVSSQAVLDLTWNSLLENKLHLHAQQAPTASCRPSNTIKMLCQGGTDTARRRAGFRDVPRETGTEAETVHAPSVCTPTTHEHCTRGRCSRRRHDIKASPKAWSPASPTLAYGTALRGGTGIIAGS